MAAWVSYMAVCVYRPSVWNGIWVGGENTHLRIKENLGTEMMSYLKKKFRRELYKCLRIWNLEDSFFSLFMIAVDFFCAKQNCWFDSKRYIENMIQGTTCLAKFFLRVILRELQDAWKSHRESSEFAVVGMEHT